MDNPSISTLESLWEGQPMELIYSKTKIYRGKHHRILVPMELYPKFKPISFLQHGQKRTEIDVFVHQKDEDTIFITEPLKELLMLPSQDTISWRLHQNICIINSLLGVFTAGFSDSSPILGARTEVFQMMTEAGKSHGYDTIFFGHQHVDLENRVINGVKWDGDSWIKTTVPYPLVIYNRLPNRKVENLPTVKEVTKDLQKSSYYFNTRFFNKWYIYDRLRKKQNCAHYLPETILHPSKQRIIDLLKKEKRIYIKPVNGSKGNGIISATLTEQTSELSCKFYHDDRVHQELYQEFDQFFQHHFPSGLHGFIVQPEINLIQKNNSAMDFRVHTNKNEYNKWELTALCAKFAGKGSLTTHVKRGGSVHTLDDFFSKEEGHQIFRKLQKAALIISENLEATLKDKIGEIGFDFGIDVDGNVWLFEANSKPGFGIFEHPSIKKEAAHILSYLYRYADFLAEQEIN